MRPSHCGITDAAVAGNTSASLFTAASGSLALHLSLMTFDVVVAELERTLSWVQRNLRASSLLPALLIVTVDSENKTNPSWENYAGTLDAFARALASATHVPVIVDRIDPSTCFGAFVMREMLSCDAVDAESSSRCSLHHLWKATVAHNWGIGRAADLGVSHLAHFDRDQTLTRTSSSTTTRDWLEVGQKVLQHNPHVFSVHPLDELMTRTCTADAPRCSMWWSDLQRGFHAREQWAPLTAQTATSLALSSSAGSRKTVASSHGEDVACGCSLNGYHRGAHGRPMLHFSFQAYILRPARYCHTVWPLQRKEIISTRSRGKLSSGAATPSTATRTTRFAPRPPGNGAILHCETMLEHALGHRHAGRPMWIPPASLGVHKSSQHSERANAHLMAQPSATVSLLRLDTTLGVGVVVCVAIAAGLCGSWLALRAFFRSA